MTQKQLAVDFLNHLIDIEVRMAAMSSILDTCYVWLPDGQKRALNWRPQVRQMWQTIRETAVAKYADTEEAIRASTDDCPDALSLLAEVAQGLV